MPTYTYKCKKCNQELTAVQSMSEDAFTNCNQLGNSCEGEVFRLISKNVGIQFVGAGFYVNDSKSTTTSSSSKK